MEIKRIRLAAMALALAVPGLALAGSGVSGISFAKVGPGIEVVIHGEDLPMPKAELSKDKRTYTLEFDAPLAGPPDRTMVQQLGLDFVQTTPGIARNSSKVKFSFAVPVKPEIEACEEGWVVSTTPAAAPRLTAKNRRSAKRITAPVVTMSEANAFDDLTAIKTNSLAKTYSGSGEAAVDRSNPKVALDFVNTDVVLILKALAMQTRVNVVTSPKVVGKVSVKIDNLSVKDALNLITSLSGLRYAEVKGSYIVTTKEDFLETLKMVGGPKEDVSETRVVPIYSGEGNQIKAAVLKTVGQDQAYGRFELVLPSERVSVTQKQSVGDGKAGEDAAQGTSLQVTSADNAKDSYVVVIGSHGRVDEIEKIVKVLDQQICAALGTRIPATNTPITKTYVVKGGRAAELVTALAGTGKTKVGTVELFSTPANSISKQTIVLKGREDEVAQVLLSLEQLDSSDMATQADFVNIDLQYSDPRSVREMLISSIPGLSVTIPPASVGNPRLFIQDQLRTQAEQRGTDMPAPQGGGSPLAAGNQNAMMQPQGAQGMPGQGGVGGMAGGMKGSKADDTGTVFPYSDMEQFAFPMKLVLRGSKEQIERAMAFVKAVDVAPKSVVLEMRVMEINKQDVNRVGLDWNLLTGGAVKFIRLNNGLTNPTNQAGIGIEGRSVSGDVTAALDALTTKNNLISRPNMLALDGRESEIFIGDAIRYVESIISSQNGPSVTTGTVRVGVRLSVFPRIGSNGSITLDLRPVVSFLRGFENVPQIGGRLPQTSERIGQSTINMMSGETIAIGGLIQEQDRLAANGLPFLKDLPVLGPLFRNTTKEKIRTDLVLFLTARVKDEPNPPVSNPLPLKPDTENKHPQEVKKGGNK